MRRLDARTATTIGVAASMLAAAGGCAESGDGESSPLVIEADGGVTDAAQRDGRSVDAAPRGDGGSGVDGEDVADGSGGEEPSPRREIVFRGLDFSESSWEVTAREGVHLRDPDEPGDSSEGDTARGVIDEPLERDVVYAWGEFETFEVEGTARAWVDGEIRRNGPERLKAPPPGEGPPIRMSVRPSVKLLERNGRAGPPMVARYAARAFEEAGYGYEIVYNLMPEQPPDEKSNCSAGDAPQWWRERVELDAAERLVADANVLMLDADGGGCAGVGRKYGTTPGRNIDEERQWREIAVGDDDWQRNMHGTLHEIGHQLGARHDHDPSQEGQQHWGAGWIEETDDGEMWWHRTPNTAGNGAPNYCGTAIEQRQRDRETGVKRHQVYNECATERFEVAPPPQ